MPRVEMKLDHAAFFAEMMCLFLMASAFFHSALSSVKKRDLHQGLKAWWAFFTTVLQSSFHHVLLGSCRAVCDGVDFLKHELFAMFVMNVVYAFFGSCEPRKLASRRVLDRWWL